MKVRRVERGAVLIMTVAIMTFVVSLVAILCSAVLFTSNLVNRNNRYSATVRRLNNDSITAFNALKSSTISDETGFVSLTVETSYVANSFVFADGIGTYKFSEDKYVATTTYSFTGTDYVLYSIVIGNQ